MTQKLPLDEVKSLPYYGRKFPFIPWRFATRVRVSLVFARRLLAELGPARFVGFWILLPLRLRPILAEGREGVHLMREKFGPMAELEWLLLLVIYRVLERRSGKDRAYAFARESIQECSEFMMPEFYQAHRLARFEDPFEAFWAYHKAMFQGDPNYPNELVEDGDLRMMIVRECRNCQIARMTIPELASVGCDHDITGYRAIEDATHMEFRRPVTLAKDGEPCRFMFYRKGTAPTGPYENH